MYYIRPPRWGTCGRERFAFCRGPIALTRLVLGRGACLSYQAPVLFKPKSKCKMIIIYILWPPFDEVEPTYSIHFKFQIVSHSKSKIIFILNQNLYYKDKKWLKTFLTPVVPLTAGTTVRIEGGGREDRSINITYSRTFLTKKNSPRPTHTLLSARDTRERQENTRQRSRRV